jgi:signal transduction histidine kinase
MSEPNEEKIVVIDDDYAMRLSCRKILSKAGFEVATFEDGLEGLEGIGRVRPALVIVDLKMPGMSGMEVISRVHEINPDVVIIVITGYATIDTAVEAMKSGAYDFLPKPFSPEELRLIVNRGLERRRLALEKRRTEIEHMLLKRRFVTFVSHELQTPLVAVRQYLEVIKHLGPSEEDRGRREEWIGRCLERTAAMQEMIRHWLTLSEVEGGTFSRKREKVDLKQVIAETLNAHRQIADAGRITLEACLPEEECCVCGDLHCFRVLLENLAGNAIKYNREGGKVTVRAERTNDVIAISVTDTGIGIEQKHIPYLFDEFFRVKDEHGKKTGGTGLGLAICKRIVTEMGGSIGVESVSGTGSTFRVCFPAWRQHEEELHAANLACG